ncbi:helix-turn-helix domain-containing protein [Paenibacillus sp. URB8-2]|uniref:helix-turn-helix domain-containing protein n=1 Tax=Paenibacillus sp. URB8-2 TaxID=2741301 RepID=UPI0015BF6FDD|nr:helix-turn-helix transcriptional regulator [Paenibacillus sp. URB8-2]BCG57454.1 hypothetical protein PUR_08790 [Paenibacillus sp. URB8-2]
MRLELNVKAVEKFMKRKGWDDKDLANNIGVSKVQVYRVFKGQRSPGNEFIAGLLSCEGAGLSLFRFEGSLPKGIEIEEDG